MVNTCILMSCVRSKNYKRLLIDRLGINFKRQLEYLLSRDKSYSMLAQDHKKVIIALAADYGNLGDVAITEAMVEFFEDFFPDYEVFELPISKTYSAMRSLKRGVGEQDIITIVGGGNMGDLYEDIESARQFVIGMFPNNLVVSFPQSISITEGNLTRLLAHFGKFYGKHRHLVQTYRDRNSYDIAMKAMPDKNVKLVPDIALYLKPILSKRKEYVNIATLCLRSDKEAQLDQSEKDELTALLGRSGIRVRETDTHVGDVEVLKSARGPLLNAIWNEFANSRFVITDRLHGMIFCVITGTPCVAIDNNNNKLRNVYNTWLTSDNNLIFVNPGDMNEVSKAVHRVIKMQQNSKRQKFEPYFAELAATISGELVGGNE